MVGFQLPGGHHDQGPGGVAGPVFPGMVGNQDFGFARARGQHHQEGGFAAGPLGLDVLQHGGLVFEQGKGAGEGQFPGGQEIMGVSEKLPHLIQKIVRGCHALQGPPEYLGAVCHQGVLLDELVLVALRTDHLRVVPGFPVFLDGQVKTVAADVVIHPPGVTVDVDDGELPDHMFQGQPPVAVDECLFKTGFRQGGVDVVPLAVPAGGMDVVLKTIAVQQAVQGEGRGRQVVPGVGHEPEHPPVQVHQGILFLGVQGIGKRVTGVADPVIQEHGQARVRVGEQGAPEGRGMEGKAVCGQCFVSKAAQPVGDAWIGMTPGFHFLPLLLKQNIQPFFTVPAGPQIICFPVFHDLQLGLNGYQ